MTKFIKFEIGILIGTVMGAAISATVCSMCFSVLGYQITDMTIIQDCLEQKINDRIDN
tara:strand:+ start:158 stop:331 length:174 start_codon:yes stop_codon:yes gene_type:complete